MYFHGERNGKRRWHVYARTSSSRFIPFLWSSGSLPFEEVYRLPKLMLLPLASCWCAGTLFPKSQVFSWGAREEFSGEILSSLLWGGWECVADLPLGTKRDHSGSFKVKLLCGWSLRGRIRYVNRRLLFVLDVLSTERSDWKDGLSLIGSYVNQS